MPSVCLLFKVHQPFQLKRYTSRDVAVLHCYEDAVADERIINTLADECYLPANEIMQALIVQWEGKFKVSYSISGTAIELFRKYRPDVIASFQQLIDTGCVEIMAETYYHSLSFLYSVNEFRRQVKKHHNLVKKIFGITPTVFRNTELIYNNSLAGEIAGMGYNGILCDGHKCILKGRTPNQLYAAPDINNFGLLLRNAALSDDIAFRFDDEQWNEYPLTARKFANWLQAHPADNDVVNIFLDYETCGIYKSREKGIFDFLEALPDEVIANTSFTFNTPGEILDTHESNEMYDCPQTVSWENKKRERYVWCENVMQNNSVKKIYSIENKVMHDGNADTLDTWGRLQAADYFNYMSEERGMADEYLYRHSFESPQDVFKNYTNIITDFELTLISKSIERDRKHFPVKYADLRLF